MGESNNVTEFVLLGLTQDPSGQKALFVMFLLIYIVTIVGNLLIVMTVIASPSLGSPIYFFLACLSFLDTGMSQLFIEHLFGGTEIVILVAMAYDRYVAICTPLHYLTIMNRRVCIILLIFSWLGGLTHSLIQTVFCDMSPLLGLVCTDTYLIGLTLIANGGAMCIIVFILLILSYGIILRSLKNHSQQGRHETLSNCSSHIMVVVLYFVPRIFMYARPVYNFSIDKFITVFYAIFTPILNPLIYTLKNSEIKIVWKNSGVKY
ncbi:Olfactory receptor 4A5 [Lemmus lemmus]